MRSISVVALVAVAAIFSPAGLAVAAPKDYCADLKGGNTGSACVIQVSDPGYSVDINIPLDYPDQKSVADLPRGGAGCPHSVRGLDDV